MLIVNDQGELRLFNVFGQDLSRVVGLDSRLHWLLDDPQIENRGIGGNFNR